MSPCSTCTDCAMVILMIDLFIDGEAVRGEGSVMKRVWWMANRVFNVKDAVGSGTASD